MKKLVNGVLVAVMCLYLLPLEAFAARQLVPVGEVIGLELSNGSVSVAAFDEELGKLAQAAGLQVGDEIVAIDGVTVDDAQDIHLALERVSSLLTYSNTYMQMVSFYNLRLLYFLLCQFLHIFFGSLFS